MYAKIIKKLDAQCRTWTQPLVHHLLSVLGQCPGTADWQTVDCYHCGMFIFGMSTLVFNCSATGKIGSTAVHRIHKFLKQQGIESYIIFSNTRHVSFLEFVIRQQEVRIFVNNNTIVAVSRRLLECMRDDNWRAMALLTLYVYHIALTIGLETQKVDELQLVVMMMQYFSSLVDGPIDVKKLAAYLNSKTRETCWSILLNPQTLSKINEQCK